MIKLNFLKNRRKRTVLLKIIIFSSYTTFTINENYIKCKSVKSCLFYTSGLDRNIAELFLQMKIKSCIHITFQEHDISCSICIKVNDPPSFDKNIFFKKFTQCRLLTTAKPSIQIQLSPCIRGILILYVSLKKRFYK